MSWQLIWADWRHYLDETWPVRQLTTWLVVGVSLVLIELIWLATYSIGQGSIAVVPRETILLSLLICLNWGFWRGVTRAYRSSHSLPVATGLRFWQQVLATLLLPLIIGLVILLPLYLGYQSGNLVSNSGIIAATGGLVIVLVSLAMTLLGFFLVTFGRVVLDNRFFQIIILLALVWSTSLLLVSQVIGNGLSWWLISLGGETNTLLLALVAVGGVLAVLVSLLEIIQPHLPPPPSSGQFLNFRVSPAGWPASFDAPAASFLAEFQRLLGWYSLLTSLVIVIPVLIISHWLLVTVSSRLIWQGLMLGLAAVVVNYRLGFSAGWQTISFSERFAFLPGGASKTTVSRWLAASVISLVIVGLLGWFSLATDQNRWPHEVGLLFFSWVSITIYFAFGRLAKLGNYQHAAWMVNILALGLFLISW